MEESERLVETLQAEVSALRRRVREEKQNDAAGGTLVSLCQIFTLVYNTCGMNRDGTDPVAFSYFASCSLCRWTHCKFMIMIFQDCSHALDLDPELLFKISSVFTIDNYVSKCNLIAILLALELA